MDKVPHKRQKKGLKKPYIFLLLALTALLCLGGVWLIRQEKPALEMPQLADPIYLLPRSSEDIVSVTLSGTQTESFTLIRGQDGKMQLEGMENTPIRSDPADALLSSLHRLEAAQEAAHLHDEEVDLSVYGLSPAQLQITVTYRDGETRLLLLGSSAPTDVAQFYCMLSGDDHLYTVYADLCDPLLQEKDYFRAFDQPELDGSLLDRIDITGDIDFSLFYTPSGWQMEAPFRYPIASLPMQSLLTRIENMAFESCLGTPEEVDLEKLGISAPALTVRLTQAPSVITGVTQTGETLSIPSPAREYTLRLGHETGKSGVYLQWEDMIYKASNFLLGFWKELNVDDFLLKTPVNLLINDLNFLKVETDKISRAYDLQMVESITQNNQIATDEYGQTLYDVLIFRQGEKEPMDSQPFLDWYLMLSGLTPSGRLPQDFVPPGEPMASITLQTSSITREMAFYPYDPFYAVLSVDGVSLYYVENSWIEKVSGAP